MRCVRTYLPPLFLFFLVGAASTQPSPILSACEVDTSQQRTSFQLSRPSSLHLGQTVAIQDFAKGMLLPLGPSQGQSFCMRLRPVLSEDVARECTLVHSGRVDATLTIRLMDRLLSSLNVSRPSPSLRPHDVQLLPFSREHRLPSPYHTSVDFLTTTYKAVASSLSSVEPSVPLLWPLVVKSPIPQRGSADMAPYAAHILVTFPTYTASLEAYEEEQTQSEEQEVHQSERINSAPAPPPWDRAFISEITYGYRFFLAVNITLPMLQGELSTSQRLMNLANKVARWTVRVLQDEESPDQPIDSKGGPVNVSVLAWRDDTDAHQSYASAASFPDLPTLLRAVNRCRTTSITVEDINSSDPILPVPPLGCTDFGALGLEDAVPLSVQVARRGKTSSFATTHCVTANLPSLPVLLFLVQTFFISLFVLLIILLGCSLSLMGVVIARIQRTAPGTLPSWLHVAEMYWLFPLPYIWRQQTQPPPHHEHNH